MPGPVGANARRTASSSQRIVNGPSQGRHVIRSRALAPSPAARPLVVDADVLDASAAGREAPIVLAPGGMGADVGLRAPPAVQIQPGEVGLVAPAGQQHRGGARAAVGALRVGPPPLRVEERSGLVARRGEARPEGRQADAADRVGAVGQGDGQILEARGRALVGCLADDVVPALEAPDSTGRRRGWRRPTRRCRSRRCRARGCSGSATRARRPG